MTPKRMFFVLTGCFVLLLALIIVSAAGGNALFEKQSKKLVDLKVQNKVIEEQSASILQAKKDIEKYSELNEIAKSIVPQDKDQAKTVREIAAIANKSGVAIKTISFETSNLGVKRPAAAPTPEDTASAPTTPPLTQVKPVEGINGVYSLEINVESKGAVSYSNLIRFLENLENNRRTSHVTKIHLKPDKTGNSLEFRLTLNAYVKP